MPDTALIEAGRVVQVWRGVSEDVVRVLSPVPLGELVEFPPEQVVCGMLWDGASLTTPEPAPVAPPASAYVVDIPTFKMRFSPAQIAAVRASDDAIVKTFLHEIIDDVRTTHVNLALPFVQDAIGYLVGIGLIGQADADRILAAA